MALRRTVNPAEGVTDGAIIVAIRPEAICFGPIDAGHAGLSGTGAEATFLGNLTDYAIDIGGMLLRVQGSRWDRHAPGTDVTFVIPTSECAALAAPSDRTPT